MSKVVTKTDPNDWARKRKEAMDRAKQMREERKHGIPDEDDHTFKPQINKRPQYLKKEESSKAPSYHDPNDIFEQPLPGAKGPQQFQEKIDQEYGTNNVGFAPQPLSSYSKPNGVQNNGRNNVQQANGNSESNYKSKFMQQYEQNIPQEEYQPPQKSKADIEAEEAFMGSLRGSSKSAVSSGWNDDTSNASIPAVPKKVSYRRRKSTDQSHSSDNNAPSATSSRPSPRKQVPEWNSDFGSGIPPVPSNQQYLRRENIQSSPSNINRGIDSAGNGGVSDVAQVRSRLSLLKSKMRKTESGNDLRSLSASEKERERQRPMERERGNEWDPPPVEPPQPRGGRRHQGNPPSASDHETNGRGYENPSHANKRVDPRQSNSSWSEMGNNAPSHHHPQANRRVGEARQQYALQAAQEREREETYQRDTYQNPSRNLPKNNQQHTPPGNYAHQDENDDRNSYSRQPSNSFSNDPDMEEDIGMGEQLECPDCGRKFNRIPYEKHVKVCAKIFIQKRKVFDSKKMRMNEELEKFQQEDKQHSKFNKKKKPAAATAAGGGERAIQPADKSSKWKEQSKQFREAMKMARLAKKAEETGGPMPEFKPSAPDPSLIRCQHCGRSFNERAAERHIPLCSNIKAKPTSLKRGTGGAGGKTGTIAGSVALGTSTGAKPLPRRR